MDWYRHTKTAGHGDTLDGRMMRSVLRELVRDVGEMRSMAAGPGIPGISPRWAGEVRRRVLLLPPVERVERMSMGELTDLRREVDEIRSEIGRRDLRWSGGEPCR